jgi:hypothetical protein
MWLCSIHSDVVIDITRITEVSIMGDWGHPKTVGFGFCTHGTNICLLFTLISPAFKGIKSIIQKVNCSTHGQKLSGFLILQTTLSKHITEKSPQQTMRLNMTIECSRNLVRVAHNVSGHHHIHHELQ